ncbi:MAG: thiamine pyrophosphate-binding protein [Polynucleobacter sp.]|nr:thiamine pyrophosphate-binding protein [Polynucleobacter sp.]
MEFEKGVTSLLSPDNDGIEYRAAAIAKAGGIEPFIANHDLEKLQLCLSEALVLGLLRQGIAKYLAIFGHGSTHLGEMLRIYSKAGVIQVFNFRNEVEMAHAATALSWVYGEVCAVVTSIGPGALQAMAGSLAAASNGVGVYHIYGDETTYGEGFNMQQIPKHEQNLYGQLTALMGKSYVLHTPEAIRNALRLGAQTVFHPNKAGPFYLMLPINTQPQLIQHLNLESLPKKLQAPKQAVAETALLEEAVDAINASNQIIFKVGGGGRTFYREIRKFAELAGATVVLSPGSTGVMPDDHPANMHVGGSKGSISGNFAMQNAELLVVIGSRAVCQSDCSGIGYPNVKKVININGDLLDLMHYNHTLGLHGDIGTVISQLNAFFVQSKSGSIEKKQWLEQCAKKKAEWKKFLNQNQGDKLLLDDVWKKPVLTQPAAIKAVCDFAKKHQAIKFFDAGDVQANGFQTVEDDVPGDTYTESGASYMGFATCAIIANGLADKPRYGIAFTGDGSFMMNPQALISAVEHGAKGMIVIFDNRRMAAISGLQHAQYGLEFRTNDSVAVDYVALAESIGGVKAFRADSNLAALNTALEKAYASGDLSVVHVSVYAGNAEGSGLGAYGSWNVGNWCESVQEVYLSSDI